MEYTEAACPPWSRYVTDQFFGRILLQSPNGGRDFFGKIRWLADATIFSMLYLLDSEFRIGAIEVRFKKHGGEEIACLQGEQMPLVERYRIKVDPGGVVYSDQER